MKLSSPPARLLTSGAVAVLAGAVLVGPAMAGGHAGPKARPGHASPASTSGTSSATFSTGQLQAQTVGSSGCGTNTAGEPAIHVSKTDLVVLGSEEGLGGGSQLWTGPSTSGAGACALSYDGQPNAVAAGLGASGGDIDVAIAPVADPATGNYRIYVASLNLASVNVATSTDNGATFTQTPVQAGLPVDDREWIAAYGPATALLSYHDIATGNIDILRSDNGGALFTQTTTAIPATDYKAGNNELGNLVIDHVNPAPGGGFYAYQSFVAPSSASGSNYNEAFVAVSSDGGNSFTDFPVPCSVNAASANGLDHNFPNVSVAPDGTLWYAWSNDTNVYTAFSTDHGQTWTCSAPVSTNTAQAIYPWLVATNSGVDLVYYGSTVAPGAKQQQVFSVYFTQNVFSAPNTTGFSTPKALVTVHDGSVCEGGVSCTGGRQLFDDFGIDTDQQGYAHIAYSHDAPALGGSGTYTGYAVQTGGTVIGAPN